MIFRKLKNYLLPNDKADIKVLIEDPLRAKELFHEKGV